MKSDKITNSKRISEGLLKYDITTFTDVIFHLPRTYLDLNYSDEFNINSGSKITILGTVLTPPRIFKGAKTTIARFKFKSLKNIIYNIIAYNQAYLLHTLKVGELYTIHGTYNAHLLEISLLKLTKGELLGQRRLVPIYTLPVMIKNHEFIKIVEKSFNNVLVEDKIPDQLVSKNGLISKIAALRKVHQPNDYNEVSVGLKTLKYEEGLLFFLKALIIKRQNKQIINDHKTIINLKVANEFIKHLPYKLTKDQIKAIREIGFDMNDQTLMYRLLQGDVGSGKTVVAMSALYINHLRKAQGALLAPTDTLARQHYVELKEYFKPYKLKIELLVGALNSSEKTIIKKQLANGEINIIIGTHALFSEDVIYNNLGLVVIDEQHKFGVNQRNKLLNKGDKADLLLLSATPIPQTLASTLYTDLDVTTISEFPNKVRNVKTIIIPTKYSDIFKLIDLNLAKHEQIYIVAPKISMGEKTSVEYLEALFTKQYGNKVSLLHGQMDETSKKQALDKFRSKETLILVSTSVIEVGINVNTASLMIIFEPTSFGLASLHQLRGRIGRNGQTAYLYLVSDEENEKLDALVQEKDGFKIAEMDLKLRGPGELTGSKQAGMPNFMYLNFIQDFALVKKTREDALLVLKEHENFENSKLINILRE